MIGPDDPRWFYLVIHLDALAATINRMERMYGDDPMFVLDLIERRSDLARIQALVYDPDSED